MKALVLADKNTWRELDLSNEINQVDMIISLGDLGYGDLARFEFIDKPKFGVYGNHCYSDYMPEFNFVNLHCKQVDFMGIKITGFEGCHEYNGEDHQYTQEVASIIGERLLPSDLFISHSPPYGIHDTSKNITSEDDGFNIAHQGFKVLRDYCEKNKPKYFLHGHTYPKTNHYKLGDTEIIYVSGHKILEFDF